MQYVLRATNSTGEDLFYTGRAGAFWLSPNRAEAFTFELAEGAERRAERFNEFTSLHCHTFDVLDA